jgi:hypothetical protein
VPTDLEEVVLQCLAKKPEDRYENASQLANALGECADARAWDPTQAPPLPNEPTSGKRVVDPGAETAIAPRAS